MPVRFTTSIDMGLIYSKGGVFSAKYSWLLTTTMSMLEVKQSERKRHVLGVHDGFIGVVYRESLGIRLTIGVVPKNTAV